MMVQSVSSVSQWWRDLCLLPDLQLSDAPRLVQTLDSVTLSHTEVHSPGARLPARHCLPAVWIINIQLGSTLVIPSRAILSCCSLNDYLADGHGLTLSIEIDFFIFMRQLDTT